MVRTKNSIRTHIEALAPRAAFARRRDARIPSRGTARGAHASSHHRRPAGQRAAARSMWAKLEAAFGSPPDLNRLLAANDEELRAAGMSRQKSG